MPDLERDSDEDEDEIEQEVQSTKNRNEPSSVKQKSNKIKQARDYDID